MQLGALGKPFAVPKKSIETKTKKFPVYGFKWRTEREHEQLADPLHDRVRGIWTLYDPEDSKVYYTDQDLNKLAADSDANHQALITKRDAIHWKEFRQGYPYFANGKWYFFEPRVDEHTGKMAAHEVTQKDILIRGQTTDSTLSLGQWEALLGKFYARLPVGYRKDKPIPADVEWVLSVPSTPWEVPQQSMISPDDLKMQRKERGLWVVEDTPHTVYLIDISVRMIMYWGTVETVHKGVRYVTWQWKIYKPRDPGWGPFNFTRFERPGVWMENNQFFWRDPLTLGLYALVKSEFYEPFRRILAGLMEQVYSAIGDLKSNAIRIIHKVDVERTTERIFNKIHSVTKAANATNKDKKINKELVAMQKRIEQLVGDDWEQFQRWIEDLRTNTSKAEAVGFMNDQQDKAKENIRKIFEEVRSWTQKHKESSKEIRDLFVKLRDNFIALEKSDLKGISEEELEQKRIPLRKEYEWLKALPGYNERITQYEKIEKLIERRDNFKRYLNLKMKSDELDDSLHDHATKLKKLQTLIRYESLFEEHERKIIEHGKPPPHKQKQIDEKKIEYQQMQDEVKAYVYSRECIDQTDRNINELSTRINQHQGAQNETIANDMQNLEKQKADKDRFGVSRAGLETVIERLKLRMQKNQSEMENLMVLEGGKRVEDSLDKITDAMNLEKEKLSALDFKYMLKDEDMEKLGFLVDRETEHRLNEVCDEVIANAKDRLKGPLSFWIHFNKAKIYNKIVSVNKSIGQAARNNELNQAKYIDWRKQQNVLKVHNINQWTLNEIKFQENNSVASDPAELGRLVMNMETALDAVEQELTEKKPKLVVQEKKSSGHSDATKVEEEPRLDDFGLLQHEDKFQILKWVYQPELPQPVWEQKKLSWVLAPIHPLPTNMSTLIHHFEDKTEELSHADAQEGPHDAQEEGQHDAQEKSLQAMFHLGARFDGVRRVYPDHRRVHFNNICPVCHDPVNSNQDRVLDNDTYFHTNCFRRIEPDFFRKVRRVHADGRTKTFNNECPVCKKPVYTDQERVLENNVFTHAECFDKENPNFFTKKRTIKKDAYYGRANKEHERKMHATPNPATNTGVQGEAPKKTWANTPPKKKTVRQPRRPPTTEWQIVSSSEDPPVLLDQNDFAKFPLIPLPDNAAPANVSRRITSPFHRSNVQYYYTNYGEDWYTWKLNEKPKPGQTKVNWECVFSAESLNVYHLREKRLYIQKLEDEKTKKMAWEMSRFIQMHRSRKKVSTGRGLMSEHVETNKMQVLDPGYMIWPLDAKKVKMLEFESTQKVNVDLTEAQAEEIKQTVNRTRKKMKEEKFGLGMQLGGRGDVHYKQRDLLRERTEKIRSEQRALRQLERDELRKLDTRDMKVLVEEGKREPTEIQVEQHEFKTHELKKPANITFDKWKDLMRLYENDSFRDMINPQEKYIIFNGEETLVVTTCQGPFSLLQCFDFFMEDMKAIGVKVQSTDELEKILGVEEAHENKEDARKDYKQMVSSLLTKYRADIELNIFEFPQEDIADWQTLKSLRETWLHAIVLAHIAKCQLVRLSQPVHKLGEWRTEPINIQADDGQTTHPIYIFQTTNEADDTPWQERCFHMAISYEDFVCFRLMDYVSKHPQIFKKATHHEEAGVKAHDVHKHTEHRAMIKSGDQVYYDLRGNITIFNLVTWEQPWDNYSFFSSVRDAAACYFDVQDNYIPNIDAFIVEWLDYLCYLPAEPLANLRREAAVKIGNNKPKNDQNLQLYVLDLVLAILGRLARGADIFMEDEQLRVLGHVGIPSRLFKHGSKIMRSDQHGGDYATLRFLICSDPNNELAIADKIIGGGAILVPLLKLICYETVIRDDIPVRGNPKAHFYHLLCASKDKVSNKRSHHENEIRHFSKQKDEQPEAPQAEPAQALPEKAKEAEDIKEPTPQATTQKKKKPELTPEQKAEKEKKEEEVKARKEKMSNEIKKTVKRGKTPQEIQREEEERKSREEAERKLREEEAERRLKEEERQRRQREESAVVKGFNPDAPKPESAPEADDTEKTQNNTKSRKKTLLEQLRNLKLKYKERINSMYEIEEIEETQRKNKIADLEMETTALEEKVAELEKKEETEPQKKTTKKNERTELFKARDNLSKVKMQLRLSKAQDQEARNRAINQRDDAKKAFNQEKNKIKDEMKKLEMDTESESDSEEEESEEEGNEEAEEERRKAARMQFNEDNLRAYNKKLSAINEQINLLKKTPMDRGVKEVKMKALDNAKHHLELKEAARLKEAEEKEREAEEESKRRRQTYEENMQKRRERDEERQRDREEREPDKRGPKQNRRNKHYRFPLKTDPLKTHTKFTRATQDPPDIHKIFEKFLAAGARDRDLDHLPVVAGGRHPMLDSPCFHQHLLMLGVKTKLTPTSQALVPAPINQIEIQPVPSNLTIVEADETNLSINNQTIYVTDIGDFPRIEYFMKSRMYPGVNRVPTRLSPGEATDLDRHEAILRFHSGDERTYTFSEVKTPLRYSPPALVNSSLGMEVLAQFHNNVSTSIKTQGVFYHEPFLIEDKSMDTAQLQEEVAENLGTESDVRTVHLSNVYLPLVVKYIVERDKVDKMTEPETVAQVDAWFKVIMDTHKKEVSEWVNEAIEQFMRRGFHIYLQLCMEALMLEYFQSKSVRNQKHYPETHVDRLLGSRKSGEQHSVVDFHTRPIKAPRNEALADHLSMHGFQVHSVCTNLHALLDSSFHDTEKIDKTLSNQVPYKYYKKSVLLRIAQAYFIDPKIADSKFPMTMDVLKVLSRVYCNEDHDMLFRREPYINFVVVEANTGSPLPGQLRVLLSSDVRGLATAFSLLGFPMPLLRKDVPQHKLENIAEGFNRDHFILQTLRDAHLMSRITVILKMGDSFKLLKRVPVATSGGATAGDILAGARWGVDRLRSFTPMDLPDIRPRIPLDEKETIAEEEEYTKIMSRKERRQADKEGRQDKWLKNPPKETKADASKNPAKPDPSKNLAKPAEEDEWPEEEAETEQPEEQEEKRVFLRALEDPVLSVLLYEIDNSKDPTRKPPIEKAALEKKLRVIFFTLRQKLEITEVWDYREDITGKNLQSFQNHKYTWYYQSVGEEKYKRLQPVKYSNLVKQGSKSLQELDTAYQKHYKQIRNAIQHNLAALEAFSVLADYMGLRFSGKVNTFDWDKMDKKEKTVWIKGGPTPEYWTLRFADNLKAPELKTDKLDQLLAYEKHIEGLICFHQLLHPLVSHTKQMVQAITDSLNPLFHMSAMCQLDLNYNHEFVLPYKKLRDNLRHYITSLMGDLTDLENGPLTLQDRSRLPWTYIDGFERKMIRYQESTHVSRMLQHVSDLKQVANDHLPDFLHNQIRLMYAIKNNDTKTRYFVEVGAGSSFGKFKRVVEKRLTMHVHTYSDNGKVYRRENRVEDTEIECTFPFTMNHQIRILLNMQQFKAIKTEMLTLNRERIKIQKEIQKEQQAKEINLEGDHDMVAYNDLRLKDLKKELEDNAEMTENMRGEWDDFVAANSLVWDGHTFVPPSKRNVLRKREEALTQLEKLYEDYRHELESFLSEDVSITDSMTNLIDMDDQHGGNRSTLHFVETKLVMDRRSLLNKQIESARRRVASAAEKIALLKEDNSKKYAEMESTQDGYVWTCPENKQTYTITRDGLANLTLQRLAVGNSGWEIQVKYPVYLEEEGRFDTEVDLWYNPREDCYVFQDYNRNYYSYSLNDKYPKWVLSSKSRYFIPVTLSMDTERLANLVENGVGLNRSDFYFNGQHLPNVGEMEFTKINDRTLYAPILLMPKDPAIWQKNDMDGMLNSRKEQEDEWKISIQKRSEGEATGRGSGNEDKGWVQSNNPSPADGKNYLVLRFLAAVSGVPNFIAVNHGSNGAELPYDEEPILGFRRSWIMTTSGYEPSLVIIHRKLFHQNFYFNPLRVPCNPTGVNARMGERYWGYDRKNWKLKMRYNPHTKSYVTGSVFNYRVVMFFEWLYNPRNWFYDKESDQFFAFCFGPDMVLCKGRLMQQMCAFRVELLVRMSPEYKKAFYDFCQSREETGRAWASLEMQGMPEKLAERYKHEQEEGFFTNETIQQTEEFYEKRAQSKKEGLLGFYSLCRSYFFSSYPWQDEKFHPPIKDDSPPSTVPAAISKILKERAYIHLQTRRLFWRLFEARFGMSYAQFLKNVADRTTVLSTCPEMLGPKDMPEMKDQSKEIVNFLVAWRNFSSPDFGEFSKNYKEYINQVPEYSPFWDDENPHEYELANAPADVSEEEWYLIQAEVKYTPLDSEGEYKLYQETHKTNMEMKAAEEAEKKEREKELERKAEEEREAKKKKRNENKLRNVEEEDGFTTRRRLRNNPHETPEYHDVSVHENPEDLRRAADSHDRDENMYNNLENIEEERPDEDSSTEDEDSSEGSSAEDSSSEGRTAENKVVQNVLEAVRSRETDDDRHQESKEAVHSIIDSILHNVSHKAEERERDREKKEAVNSIIDSILYNVSRETEWNQQKRKKTVNKEAARQRKLQEEEKKREEARKEELERQEEARLKEEARMRKRQEQEELRRKEAEAYNTKMAEVEAQHRKAKEEAQKRHEEQRKGQKDQPTPPKPTSDFPGVRNPPAPQENAWSARSRRQKEERERQFEEEKQRLETLYSENTPKWSERLEMEEGSKDQRKRAQFEMQDPRFAQSMAQNRPIKFQQDQDNEFYEDEMGVLTRKVFHADGVGVFTIKPAPKDGDCLFVSFETLLKTGLEVETLRQNTVNYLDRVYGWEDKFAVINQHISEDNGWPSKDFPSLEFQTVEGKIRIGFAPERFDQYWEFYKKYMGTPKWAFANQSEINALSTMYEVNFVIWQEGTRGHATVYSCIVQDRSWPILHLMYSGAPVKNHYDPTDIPYNFIPAGVTPQRLALGEAFLKKGAHIPRVDDPCQRAVHPTEHVGH